MILTAWFGEWGQRAHGAGVDRVEPPLLNRWVGCPRARLAALLNEFERRDQLRDGDPSLASFRIPTIWGSVNRDFRIGMPPQEAHRKSILAGLRDRELTIPSAVRLRFGCAKSLWCFSLAARALYFRRTSRIFS